MTLHRIARRLPLVALVATLAACGGSKPAATPSATTVAVAAVAPSSAPAAPAAATAITVADFSFGPAAVTIPAGASVTWTNRDGQAHTVTAAGSFDLGAIAPGTTASHRFDVPGTYSYICAFHPFMTGTVNVT